MEVVPENTDGIMQWITVVNRQDEGDPHSDIYTDIVYVSNPHKRLVVRIRGMIKTCRLEGIRLVRGEDIATDGANQITNDIDR